LFEFVPGGSQRGRQRDQFLRAAHPLKIALQRFDRLIGELQRIDLRELIAQKIDSIRREFRFVGDPPPVRGGLASACL
jgi:hypothetical protein